MPRGSVGATRTHCPQGHPYDEANTKHYRGRRYCRACRSPYRQHLSDRCERCGFVPEDLCQLDIHHRDHDHSNNDPANLGTLCANCHRLEHGRY